MVVSPRGKAKMKVGTGMEACRKPVRSIIGKIDGFLLGVEPSN